MRLFHFAPEPEMQLTPVTSNRAMEAESGESAATASSLPRVTTMCVAPLSYSSIGSSDRSTPSVARSASASSSARTVGTGCCIRPNTRAPDSSRSSSTGTIPMPVSSSITPRWSGCARTQAVPRTGWPANDISWRGLKIRIRACPPASAGSTNVVSEKPISSASACMRSGPISRASVKTASWFPASAVSVNTSTTT